MRALIGSNGTVGRSLLSQMTFDAEFNSDNLEKIAESSWEMVVCSAPSGNRLKINQGHTQDFQDCEALVNTLSKCKINKLVLIGSIDAVTALDTEYGRNRAWLEQELKQIHKTYVLRLSSLIGSQIKKNVLFDLKHGVWLDNLERDAQLQWCLLNDLSRQIDQCIAGAPGSINIVSEPINNIEIINKFFPHIKLGCSSSSVRYNQQPYVYTKQQIFNAMEEYLK